MRRTNAFVFAAVTVLAFAGIAEAQRGGDAADMFNTVKTKLANGQQVVGGTVSTPDPDIYCAMANAGFDFFGSKCSTAHSRTPMLPG